MYEPFASSVGTANLLKHLESSQSLVEKFNDVSNPEPKGIDLLEQLKDLIAVTASLDDLATKERRNSSAHLKYLSPSDLVHLHAICSSTATLTRECSEHLEPLQSGLEDLLHDRDSASARFKLSEDLLGEQAWYDETYQALRLRTEVLQVLLAAINVLQYKNDVDEDGNLSSTARSFATTLPYRIALVNSKLHDAPAQSITMVSDKRSFRHTLLIQMKAAKSRDSRHSREVACPCSIPKQAL